jgi:hypothetical protein
MVKREVVSTYCDLQAALNHELDLASKEYADCVERLENSLNKLPSQAANTGCIEYRKQVDRILSGLARLEPVIAHEETANKFRSKKNQAHKESSLYLHATSNTFAAVSVIALTKPAVSAWLGPALAGASALMASLASLLASSDRPVREDHQTILEFRLSRFEFNDMAVAPEEWRLLIKLLVALRESLSSLVVSIDRYLGVAKHNVSPDRCRTEILQLRAIVHNARETFRIIRTLRSHSRRVNQSFRQKSLPHMMTIKDVPQGYFAADRNGTLFDVLHKNLNEFRNSAPSSLDTGRTLAFLQNVDRQYFDQGQIGFTGDILDSRLDNTLRMLMIDLQEIAREHDHLREALVHFGSWYIFDRQ